MLPPTSSARHVRMPALKVFFFLLFSPQHFSWQEADSEKVLTKAGAPTLEITRRLNEISVGLSRGRPRAPSPSARHCGQRARRTLLIYLCSLCSSEAHFLKGGNWHFYISYGIPPPYL